MKFYTISLLLFHIFPYKSYDIVLNEKDRMQKRIHIPIAGEINPYPYPAEESMNSIHPPSYQSACESERNTSVPVITREPTSQKQNSVNPNSEITADEKDDAICPEDMTRAEWCYCILSIVALIVTCPLFCLYAIIMGQLKKSVW